MGKSRILAVRAAGPDHQVITAVSDQHSYRRRPCLDCPWRVDATGIFPPEAFAHSAVTAYDMSRRTFACHQSGRDRPATCAGFLLRGAAHNLNVRQRLALSEINMAEVEAGGVTLHPSYRAMAIANGVSPDHPALAACRDDAAYLGDDD